MYLEVRFHHLRSERLSEAGALGVPQGTREKFAHHRTPRAAQRPFLAQQSDAHERVARAYVVARWEVTCLLSARVVMVEGMDVLTSGTVRTRQCGSRMGLR